MTSYFIGDKPAEVHTVVPTRAGNVIDLEPFLNVTAVLYDGAGVQVDTAPGFGLVLDKDDREVRVTWPSGYEFETPGLYSLVLTLSGFGTSETMDDVPVVIQAHDGWHTLDSARRQIEQGLPTDDSQVWALLEVAKAAVIAFAPALPEDSRPPVNYVQAQLMQTRNVLNSSITTPVDDGQGGTYTISPRPLDWAIKQLLRPKTVVGGIA